MFATSLAFIVPVFEAPDEPHHIAYVNFVAQRAALPNQFRPDERVEVEGHQPPLYYIVAAFVVRLIDGDHRIDVVARPNPRHAWNGGSTDRVPLHAHVATNVFLSPRDQVAFYSLRLLSVLISAGTLWVLLDLALRLNHWSPARSAPFGASALVPAFGVATLPQFAFISGVVTNDNLANLFAALALAGTVRVIAGPRPTRELLWLGLVLGLGLLTKRTIVVLVPPILLIVAWSLGGRRPVERAVAFAALGGLILLVLVAGLDIARNTVLYGDPFGQQVERNTIPFLLRPKSLLSSYFVDPFLPGLFRSFVGTFGWMNVSLPGFIYTGYLVLLGMALVGLTLGFGRGDGPAVTPVSALAVLTIATCLGGIVLYNTTYSQFQGRFIFPALGAMMLLWTLGLDRLAALIGPARHRLLLASLIVVFLAADVGAISVIYDFYYRPEQYTGG